MLTENDQVSIRSGAEVDEETMRGADQVSAHLLMVTARMLPE